jgi:hypothetical protein
MNKARTEDEILRHQTRIADLYLAGRSQQQIGEELGLSQQTVSRELATIRWWWGASAARDVAAAQALELDRLDRLEPEAWDAWERSKGSLVTTESGTENAAAGTGAGGRSAARRVTRAWTRTRKADRDGDPRYLAEVARCIRLRCKILVLYPR